MSTRINGQELCRGVSSPVQRHAPFYHGQSAQLPSAETCTIQPQAISRGHFQDSKSPLPSYSDSVNYYFLVPVVSYVSCFYHFIFLSFVFILQSLICPTDFAQLCCYSWPCAFSYEDKEDLDCECSWIVDAWVPLLGCPLRFPGSYVLELKKKMGWECMDINRNRETIYKEREEHCPE